MELIIRNFIPYGRQQIDQCDIEAVIEVLRSDWLTTGPKVDEFEKAFAEFVDAREAVAVCNGTAALHAAMAALEIGPGDEVIVPAITFAATANAVVYMGGTPVLVDIEADTLLISIEAAEAAITDRTRAIVGVDYAGQPCDWTALRTIANRHDLRLIADASHAVGAFERGRKVGSLADLSTFSFHPVKHIATGEGGMITTNEPALAKRMRVFRNHGITTDHRQRSESGSWHYEMVSLGYNYRLSDIQCALGISQLTRQDEWLTLRRQLADRYDRLLGPINGVSQLARRPETEHAWHLYVIQLDLKFAQHRQAIFDSLRNAGIGVNVHYIPVSHHPFYRERFNVGPGSFPKADDAYERILSLPMYPALENTEQDRVIEALVSAMQGVAL